MGKVPALGDGGVVITETPAICLHLADRYGYGRLAPRIEDADRGLYLRWTVFSTAVFEPAIWLHEAADPIASRGRGWGDHDTVVKVVEDLLAAADPWILGGRFSGADITLGAVLAFALYNQRLAETPVLKACNDRLAARPAYQRSGAATWPPELFARQS